ncbi:hypothetical protein [Nonomuraea jiangxiensis]|uniref:hypothetical protein n=1 Tax=Nonomuraea jiangxiensis TaxID=633440 RepID=UPI00115F971E|nr:hypothetical protein [Nonomuraea jiangxiensis]
MAPSRKRLGGLATLAAAEHAVREAAPAAHRLIGETVSAPAYAWSPVVGTDKTGTLVPPPYPLIN